MEMTAIDLFCGAGGLSEGFRQAGFHILAGNDIDEYAGETFKAAHAEAEFFPGQIEHIRAGEFLNATGLKKGELDCLIGGPPCQAFSVYNQSYGQIWCMANSSGGDRIFRFTLFDFNPVPELHTLNDFGQVVKAA